MTVWAAEIWGTTEPGLSARQLSTIWPVSPLAVTAKLWLSIQTWDSKWTETGCALHCCHKVKGEGKWNYNHGHAEPPTRLSPSFKTERPNTEEARHMHTCKHTGTALPCPTRRTEPQIESSKHNLKLPGENPLASLLLLLSTVFSFLHRKYSSGICNVYREVSYLLRPMPSVWWSGQMTWQRRDSFSSVSFPPSFLIPASQSCA